MKKRFLFVLLAVSFVFIGGCVQQDNAKTEAPEKIKIQQPNIETQGRDQQDIPICKTITARGCRIVEGVTESGKSSQSDGSNGIFKRQQKCSGEGTVALSSPMKLEDIGMVVPMGLMIGGHVTPIDHMYFSPKDFHSKPDTYEVYADADGTITEISVEPNNPDNKYKKIRVVIMHTCDFYSIYNLLTSLSPEITGVTGEMSYGDHWFGSIGVNNGQLMGRIGGQTLDLSVNYDKVVLKGFIVPEHYEGEPWKIHTVDPFDYFEDTYRSQLLEKNIRTALPLGGKIDYDIDGRLAGNWFEENTGGYRGGGDSMEYWDTHLSIAYDAVDPAHVIISMGNYDGDTKQAAAKGNYPDPKEVSVSTGPVKYELAGFEYALEDGKPWDRMSVAKGLKVMESGMVEGTVLAQMISGRKMKFEAFPGRTAAQVTGFTDKAKIYER